MTQAMFKRWLLDSGKTESTAYSYANAINSISKHYSSQTGGEIDVYKIKERDKIKELVGCYIKSGKFSAFGDQSNGTPRAAIIQYFDFFDEVQGRGLNDTSEFEGEVRNLNSESPDRFSYESDLQTALCSNILELFPGYNIYGGLGVGVQYSVGGKKIDVLLEHKDNGNLLVIELKSGEASHEVFGQISMYIGRIQEEFPERVVRGMIIAGSINENLVYACRAESQVSLKTYRMSIDLEDVQDWGS